MQRGGGGLYHPTGTDLPFEIAVPKGDVPGVTFVTKFGRNTDVDAAVEDIWSGASAIPQLIWLPPTVGTGAQTHTIASTSASDDGPSGVGARTIRVYGLTSWTTAEASEDITMDGAGANAQVTSNSYVIIHRMEVLTKGATNVNVGTITATADTDNTVTAQIEPGRGQTEMAIYGVPSVQAFYMTQYSASLGTGSGAAQTLDITLRVNPEPNTEELNYLVKHSVGLSQDGSSHFNHNFNPRFRIPGPAIIKLQGIASGANNVVDASFEGYLVTE